MSAQTILPVFIRGDAGELNRIGTATLLDDRSGFVLVLGQIVTGNKSVSHAPAQASGGGPVFPPYGRAKGMPVHGAPEGDLRFYAGGARRSIGDPSKARFHDKERALFAAIQAELARQGLDPEEEPGEAPAVDDQLPV